jgi:hypothetical protein
MIFSSIKCKSTFTRFNLDLQKIGWVQDKHTAEMGQNFALEFLKPTSLCVGINFHGIPSATSALNWTVISLKTN